MKLINQKIENVKTLFFSDKEHYLNFKKAWANYISNDGRLTAAHYVLYNLLRGKDPFVGFAPILNQIKLYNGIRYNQGYYYACDDLNTQLKRAITLLEEPREVMTYSGLNKGKMEWNTDVLSTHKRWCLDALQRSTILDPFGGTVTIETLQKLQPMFSTEDGWIYYPNNKVFHQALTEGIRLNQHMDLSTVVDIFQCVQQHKEEVKQVDSSIFGWIRSLFNKQKSFGSCKYALHRSDV